MVTHVMIFTAHQQVAVATSYNKLVRPSVCLSVCPHAGIISKWLKLRSCGLHWTGE